ncbi:MAG TPA: hypothetical protein VE954_43325 [Oligoflexus sp.]|uniref:hypothetical protein n=1 Tax=Oligoflexus sp. TaxID=1971216 RepID=UPI002D4D253B|nr:hypothetical protein [Oligoflexus sp.]HYX39977.1 hypothetical protein [Oligoflexus sp.]
MNTLDRLKELESKATPGPWDHDINGHLFQFKKPGHEGDIVWVDTFNDASLIVEMRETLPKILALVDAFKVLDLRCEVEDVMVDEPPCGDCEICRVNALMDQL